MYLRDLQSWSLYSQCDFVANHSVVVIESHDKHQHSMNRRTGFYEVICSQF